MEYKEEEFLMLSGLQHFLFCRRQWALIHIEQQWAENLRTVEGNLMHKNVHDRDFQEKRGDIIKIGAMKVQSYKLGLSGECDMVEFHKDSIGIPLKERDGLWQIFPIEYKKGKAKQDESDKAQLCAQAMCLEEMFCCNILRGSLYYGETRRRLEVEFTDDLRQLVTNSVEEMHAMFRRGYTPIVRWKKGCNACSLHDICLPVLLKKQSVQQYIQHELEDE